jgi:hypothetical protein
MNAECHACIGGTNVREDGRKLEEGKHVIVGTPGRVYDMIQRGHLSKCKPFSVGQIFQIFFTSSLFLSYQAFKNAASFLEPVIPEIKINIYKSM